MVMITNAPGGAAMLKDKPASLIDRARVRARTAQRRPW